MFGPRDSENLQKSINCVTQSDISHEMLSAEEVGNADTCFSDL